MWFLPRSSDTMQYVCLCDPAIDWQAMGLTDEPDKAQAATGAAAVDGGVDGGPEKQTSSGVPKAPRTRAAFCADYAHDPHAEALTLRSGAVPIVFDLHPPHPYVFARTAAQYTDAMISLRRGVPAGQLLACVEQSTDRLYVIARLGLCGISIGGVQQTIDTEMIEGQPCATLAQARSLPLDLVRELAEQVERLASLDAVLRKNS